DIRQMIKPSGVWMKLLRTWPHHGAEASEQDEGMVLPQLFHRRQHLDADPLTIAHAVLFVQALRVRPGREVEHTRQHGHVDAVGRVIEDRAKIRGIIMKCSGISMCVVLCATSGRKLPSSRMPISPRMAIGCPSRRCNTGRVITEAALP